MRKLALIILDGWGLGEEKENNAIHVAKTPFFDSLWNTYPHTILQASEEYVGLPHGQIGGSEVGHLTIGAGRVLYQDLVRINHGVTHPEEHDGILTKENFQKLIALAKEKQLHLIGSISPGGVHSHEDYFLHMLEILKNAGCKSPFIHFISDGRDTPPESGIKSAKRLKNKITELQFGKIVTLVGRFFAMDRDRNFDRTKKAADLFTNPEKVESNDLAINGDWFTNLEEAFGDTYSKGITDEFIEPVLIDKTFKGIKNDDVLFFFNFRSDRMKQIITELHSRLKDVSFFTLTQYDKSYSYPIIYGKQIVTNTLGEILSKQGVTQLRAAETEKFPHVTYFFNGGVEVIFEGEIRSLSESNKVKHDVMPEMKAAEIEERVETIVKEKEPVFILVNFANPDMVGHTGNFKAALKGVETVDQQLKKMCDLLSSHGYICCVTADHGNADIMYDLVTREPHTAHTINPVPFIVYDLHDEKNQKLKLDQAHDNSLAHIAGTVLELMEVQKPDHDYQSLITS